MALRPVSLAAARRIWLHAQRLDTAEPFGAGAAAALAAVEHLGYVQIDTINVVERSHHHILYCRIPAYRRGDLRQLQTIDKSVFEYWTHALAYVPTRDFRFFVPDMKAHRREPTGWAAAVPLSEVRRVVRLIGKDGPVSIRDIEDEVLVEKEHPWASRKPSKGALQRGFYDGRLAVSERVGIVKTYELLQRHFGWPSLPRGETPRQVMDYLLDRALRTQGLVSLQSIHHTHARFRPALRARIESRVRRGLLVPAALEGAGEIEHWAAPETLEHTAPEPRLTHILSPFDPLIIQRKRLERFFGYAHLFEAYIPKQKRKLGYFALPVLIGDEIVAALDLKTDRAAGSLLLQAWRWLDPARPRAHKRLIEEELHRFEAFQLAP